MLLKYSIISLILSLLALNFHARSQEVSERDLPNIDTEYDRASLSLMLTDRQKNHPHWELMKSTVENYTIDDKYFHNRIPSLLLNAEGQNFNQEAILSRLYEQQIPAEVTNYWFGTLEQDGEWSVDTLIHRGRYNLTDAEVRYLQATATGYEYGSRRASWGEKLMRNSFVVVLDVTQIRARENEALMRPAELRRNREANNQLKKLESLEYTATIRAYVYQVNYHDSIMAQVWDSWSDLEKRENIRFHLKPFTNYTFNERVEISYNEGTRLKTGSGGLNINVRAANQVMRQLMNNSTSNNMTDAQRRRQDSLNRYEGMIFTPEQLRKEHEECVEDLMNAGIDNLFRRLYHYEVFKVKAPVFDIFPVQAKIGRKEGLRIDQRFFVYEFSRDEFGDIVPHKVGAVRVSRKIDDNRGYATGESENTTRFYRIHGRARQGMLLRQKATDIGMTISAGGAFLTDTEYRQPFNFRIAYNLSPLLFPKGGSAAISQLRLYGQISAGSKPDNEVLNSVDLSYNGRNIADNGFNTGVYTLGLEKAYYFFSYLHFTPFAGVGYIQVNYNNSNLSNMLTSGLNYEQEDISTFHAEVGAFFGFNLKHNLQLSAMGVFMPMHYRLNPMLSQTRSIELQRADNLRSNQEIFNELNSTLLIGFQLRYDF